MLETFFPLGLCNYAFGGLLVGIGISIPFIATGLVVGISSFYTVVWSYVHKGWFFQTNWYIQSRGWKWFLVGGIVSGGVVYLSLYGSTIITTIPWWRLLLGGILVGVGARMSGGCTSGHAICGLASLEKVSLVATVTFLATAIAVALFTSKVLVW
ncbi:YeeE/YedE family protein [Candidatus Kaiserbacteria bacterium]|nr:YeeE/YedE family protein [Candidatus Kaiserbacteria bacterium]NCT01920.1 YeeE/YedE family protein [Candidatus Parcubacteria bacterium]